MKQYAGLRYRGWEKVNIRLLYSETATILSQGVIATIKGAGQRGGGKSGPRLIFSSCVFVGFQFSVNSVGPFVAKVRVGLSTVRLSNQG